MKLNIEYWNKKWAEPTELDLKAIADCYIGELMTEEEKLSLTVLFLQGSVRFPDTEEGDRQMETLLSACEKYENHFSPEEMTYLESNWVITMWRYSYKEFMQVIPIYYKKGAVKTIYKRLGVELNDAEVIRVIESDFVYSDFLDTLTKALGRSKYIICPDPTKVSAFVFAAYFNMWYFFGILGFNGYSPYTVCRDIGVISVSANDWRFVALPEGAPEVIDELCHNTRKLSYPTMQQKQFIAKLAKI